MPLLALSEKKGMVVGMRRWTTHHSDLFSLLGRLYKQQSTGSVGVAARAGEALQFTTHFTQGQRGERKELNFEKFCLSLVRWLGVEGMPCKPDDWCSVPRTHIKREGEI